MKLCFLEVVLVSFRSFDIRQFNPNIGSRFYTIELVALAGLVYERLSIKDKSLSVQKIHSSMNRLAIR